jgi:hypothetical protein
LLLPPIKSSGLTEFGAKLKSRATAHRAVVDNPEAMAEDRNKYKKACYDLRIVIKGATGKCRKVESYHTGSDACRMLQGLQSVTNYKGNGGATVPPSTSTGLQWSR